MYADDVVLLSPTFDGAQKQLEALSQWCEKWWMSINPAKSPAIHVRHPQWPLNKGKLKCGEHDIFVDRYKYLGVLFHEHLSFIPMVEALMSSASKSFGRIVFLFKSLQNMGIRTYETLHSSYVVPIMNYGAAVGGFS